MDTYTLAQIREGSGWPKGARFALVEPEPTAAIYSRMAAEPEPPETVEAQREAVRAKTDALVGLVYGETVNHPYQVVVLTTLATTEVCRVSTYGTDAHDALARVAAHIADGTMHGGHPCAEGQR